MKTTKKMMTQLDKLIKINGAAQVAVWLGYRDTRPINQWITRGEIPRAKIPLVKEVIEKKVNK